MTTPVKQALLTSRKQSANMFINCFCKVDKHWHQLVYEEGAVLMSSFVGWLAKDFFLTPYHK